MPALSDWQVRLSGHLQHFGQIITNALVWVPNWVAAIVLLILLTLLVRHALRQMKSSPDDGRKSKSQLKTKEERRES